MHLCIYLKNVLLNLVNTCFLFLFMSIVYLYSYIIYHILKKVCSAPGPPHVVPTDLSPSVRRRWRKLAYDAAGPVVPVSFTYHPTRASPLQHTAQPLSKTRKTIVSFSNRPLGIRLIRPSRRGALHCLVSPLAFKGFYFLFFSCF